MPDDTGQQAAKPERVPVIGVGASAGGITALQAFFEALPVDVGAAVVVVIHLDPQHRSELTEILSKRTAMPVSQVHDEPMPLGMNRVYVIPPNRNLLIEGDSIAAVEFNEARGQRAPIDRFFISLAEQHGDGFAVVLSGSGSDGAVGVRVLREKGAIILVQDPAEAEFASMPRNAMASGADFVLPVHEIAAALPELVKAKGQVAAAPIDNDEEALRRILVYLRSRTGQDFSGYKRATVVRRIARRMQVTQSERMDQYLAFLRKHDEEVKALFNDLLISVTSFFRDPDAFAALAKEVIAPLFSDPSEENVIRAWIPGCATGEEAYSIAILLMEEAARREARAEIQVFATDLDEQALAVAREGRYPIAVSAEVSEERLRRFFAREGDFYRIRREVRDLVVFASHSLLKDPPFSHIDLVSCRNLLIYLDKTLQNQIVEILHYALEPNGYLFLGTSESVDNPPGLFVPVDRTARIFRAAPTPRDRLPMLPRLSIPARGLEFPTAARLPRVTNAPDFSVHRQALEDLAPPSMLVDEHHLVINLSETCGRFVRHPSGPLSADAAEIVLPELRLDLRAALNRAFEHDEPTVSLPIPVQFNGKRKNVVLHVRPVRQENAQPTALALFMEGGVIEPDGEHRAGSADSSAVAQLREELNATRMVLRTTREQYETATEDLRAANEELQSINEEYRSTAEELETSKEELQSINEELQTVNNELKLKLEMVSRAHSDLQNLMSATDISTMFLDSQLRIQKFTPRIAELFNIVPGDEGRPVTDFTHKLDYQDLMEDARRVLADLVPIERTIKTTIGRWFLMRLRPYRTVDDKIEGVVVTFVDVTEQREAETALQAVQRRLRDELSHRVRNTLSVVQAIVRQSLRGSGASHDAQATLGARLKALAATHDLLVRNEWRGVGLEQIVREQLAPYNAGGSDTIRLSGPSVVIPAGLATPIGLALHELATNAAKHGSLSVAAGRIELSWSLRTLDNGVQALEMTWTESGGPPIAQPKHQGAGAMLIDRGIPGATVERRFEPKGLVCAISVPLTEMEAIEDHP